MIPILKFFNAFSEKIVVVFTAAGRAYHINENFYSSIGMEELSALSLSCLPIFVLLYSL